MCGACGDLRYPVLPGAAVGGVEGERVRRLVVVRRRVDYQPGVDLD